MKNKIYLILVVLSFAFNAKAMIFDNRYFPLYMKPRLKNIYSPSSLSVQTFFMYGDHAFGDFSIVGLPDIGGFYDEANRRVRSSYNQSEIAKAIVLSGRSATNPLRSDLQDVAIPWDREGVVNAQGMTFYWEQEVDCNFSFGVNGLFMHYNNSQEFLFNDDCLNFSTAGEKDYLFLVNQQMSNLLNLTAPIASDTGFGDIDFYLRFGKYFEYIYKFRRAEAGVRLGFIAPTALQRDIYNPASLPIGGNGHWGIYTAVDGEFELREDIIIGLYTRLNKRFSRSGIYRMPILTEPVNYGALIGTAVVDPGLTFIFAPYGKYECLRDALGVGLGYTLVVHQEDQWSEFSTTVSDSSNSNDVVSANIDNIISQSKWKSSYVTLSAFYDFSKFKEYASLLPIVTLSWDMPFDRPAKNVYQTHCVSLILQVNF